jgi:predicted acetyltransferase
VRERAAPVTPLDDLHRNEVERCYREFAAQNDGWLDRGPYGWERVREPRGEKAPGFGIVNGDRVDGYVYFQQRRKLDTGRQELLPSDIAFRTAEAGRRLLGFFADFATVGDEVVFGGGPHHPLLWLLGQQRYTVALKDYWMVALTNVKAALEARGYSEAVRADIALDVVDEVTPENAGRLLLRVEGGRGTVESLPRGNAARIGVGPLAALYTGFTSPKRLRAMGALDADDRTVDALGAAFAGSAPAMTDTF